MAGEFALEPSNFKVTVTCGIVTITGIMERQDTAPELLAVRHAKTS